MSKRPSKARKKKTKQKIGKSAKRKGKDGENMWCRRLDVLLPSMSPWHRNLGVVGKQDWGDLLTADEPQPYYVECKNYHSSTHKQIMKWWWDAKEKAQKVGKPYVLLCVKIDRFPWTVFTNMSLHYSLKSRARDYGIFLVDLEVS